MNRREFLCGVLGGGLISGCLPSGLPGFGEGCGCDDEKFDFDSLASRPVMLDNQGQLWEGQAPFGGAGTVVPEAESLDIDLSFSEFDGTPDKIEAQERGLCYTYKDGSKVCETFDGKYKVRVGGVGKEQINCKAAPGGKIPMGNWHTHLELTVAGRGTGTIHVGKFTNSQGKWCAFVQNSSTKCWVQCAPTWRNLKPPIEAALLAACATAGIAASAAVISTLADALAVLLISLMAL